MKLKIGDSVKLKDGRKFKVVSKDNGYFVLKDSKGKMAKVKDSTYSPEDMLFYLIKLSWDFSVTFSELKHGIIKMLKEPTLDNTEEYLEMYGTNEDMDKAILKFVKENPNFDWESVEL